MSRAERHANSDLPCSLRHRISKHAIKTHDSEQQRHAAGDGKHHQSERSPRHGLPVEVFQRMHVGDREIRIHRPHGPPDLAHEAFRARSGAADGDVHVSAHHVFIALEMPHHDGPVDGGGYLLIHAIVVNVSHHTRDFTPVVIVCHADLFTQCIGRVVPIFTCHAL